MKKIVILKPNCRELANHLWNYLSIYAYGLETGARVQNPSFSKWHRYFNLSGGEIWIWETLLSLYGSYLIRFRQTCVLLTLSSIMYLPPTKRHSVSPASCDTTYFIGWLFRNPAGLEKYRDKLVAAFTPNATVLGMITTILALFSGKKLIGIHLRQTPFKGFEDDPFTVPATRVRAIVDEYLREKNIDAKDAALVIVSDEAVDENLWKDFAVYKNRGNTVANLFLLSKCQVVIGTNSSFSNLAAWFGNVPHVVESNQPIDWDYYRNKEMYFENKYATFAF